MSPEYKLGYSRGYNAGCARKWPAHKPVRPPLQLLANLMAAASELRDGVDGHYLATVDDDDELSQKLGPLVDAVDRAFVEISDWIRSPKESDGGEK